jgi:RNA polymerase sigma-70 factor (ECF subfamily)
VVVGLRRLGPDPVGHRLELRGKVLVASIVHACLYEREDRFQTRDRARLLFVIIAPVQGKDFERLYGEHAAPLLRFLILRVGNRASAEDVLADAFERVLRSGRRFDPRRGSEKAWLYTIALNLVRDRGRRMAAEARALERVGGGRDEQSGEEGIAAAVARNDLVGALQELPVEQHEVVALRFGGDLTVPEIARVRGERRSTVEGQLYRALRKLRQHLD